MDRRARSNIGLFLARAAGLAAAVVLVGCSHWFKSERLADGSYRVSCESPLPECLARVEELCDRKRYLVIRAVDRHNLRGVNPAPHDWRTSEAIVRCGQNFQTASSKDDMTAPEPAPCAPVSPRTCVPGVTQACVGAGGCPGGQACLSDGSGFAPCDCGGAAADASASS